MKFLLGFALLIAASNCSKKAMTTATNTNRNVALPDDATIDPNSAPSVLVATFIRANGSAQLVWDRPVSDIGADYHYEVYRATLDASGTAQAAATQVLSADNSVLEATVAVPQVTAGQVVAFNLVVRTGTAARDSVGAAFGSASNLQVIHLQQPEAAFAVTCASGSTPGDSGESHVFTSDLNNKTTVAKGSTQAHLVGSTHAQPADLLPPVWLSASDGIFLGDGGTSNALASVSGTSPIDLATGAGLLSPTDFPAGQTLVALSSDAEGIAVLATYAPTDTGPGPLQNAWVINTLSSKRVTLDLSAFDKNTLNFAWMPGRAALLVATGMSADDTHLAASSFWFSDGSLFASASAVAGTAAAPLALPSGVNGKNFLGYNYVDTSVPTIIHTLFFEGIGSTDANPVNITWTLSISPTASTFTSSGSYALSPNIAPNAPGGVSSLTGRSGPNDINPTFTVRVSPDGKYLAAVGKPAASGANCVLVWPFGTNVTLDAATFAACHNGVNFGAAYDATAPGNLDLTYDWMWVPARFTDAGKDLILVGDATTAAGTIYQVINASTGTPAAPTPLTTCNGDFSFELDLGFPIAVGGKSRMLLGCSSAGASGGTVYDVALTDLQTAGAHASLNTTGDLLVSFGNNQVSSGQNPGLAFISGAAAPFTLNYVDGSDATTLNLRLSTIGSLPAAPGAYETPTFYQARDGHAALMPDQMVSLDDCATALTLSPTTTTLGLWESDATTSFAQTNGNLLSTLPNAPAGTPIVIFQPDPVPGQDYYIFAVYFASGATLDCTTGLDPNNVRVYTADLQTCKSGTCAIADITPTSWGCATNETVRQLSVSVNPLSFAKTNY